MRCGSCRMPNRQMRARRFIERKGSVLPSISTAVSTTRAVVAGMVTP